MTKQEIVIDTLGKYNFVNAAQLAGWIKRTHNIDMTASSVSGVLRSLVNKGIVGKSNCGAGKTTYWLVKE